MGKCRGDGMIKMQYLVDCNGADKFGTCMGCGKGSKEDQWMVRIIVSFDNHGARQGTTFCLCNECRSEMRGELE